jgi:hypothetical protein
MMLLVVRLIVGVDLSLLLLGIFDVIVKTKLVVSDKTMESVVSIYLSDGFPYHHGPSHLHFSNCDVETEVIIYLLISLRFQNNRLSKHSVVLLLAVVFQLYTSCLVVLFSPTEQHLFPCSLGKNFLRPFSYLFICLLTKQLFPKPLTQLALSLSRFHLIRHSPVTILPSSSPLIFFYCVDTSFEIFSTLNLYG